MPTPDDYANNQPGLLQRGPTSLLPPIPPPSTNDNDPTKTQEAAIPRVPPPTPRSDRQPTPGDTQSPPPTPSAPYTPVPWHAQQPPPAPPEPPLGNWTPDQVAPWLKPHLPTIPGSLVPNRPPDGYRGNQPVYNLRPGEPGYTAGGNSNILTGAVSWLESRNQGPFGDPSTLGQKAAFQAQYGAGPQGITNYAQQLLRANPNATFGDFYAGYALGTGDPRRAPTIEDLRTRYPEAYKNLVTNFPAQAGGGRALPGTPSGPQGPWTQANLEANFAYRTGQLGQPGNVQLTNVTSPNGQSWQVNQRVAPQFQGFLNDLYKAGYTGMSSSGGYNNRPIVGGTIPSEHAYGAAIDIGAAHNPLQYVSAGGALRTDLPPNVGEIAAKWGLKWGGTFHDRQDPMHFEVAALMTTEQIQAAQNGAVTTAPQGTRVNAGAIGINTPLSTLLGSTVAAPPQQYIPPQPREPQHWGREPEHDWTPGRMPTSHDIPNILGALLPIAIAGVLGGGGLGMIAAYAGYQNARNKGQLEEAKEQKTKWKDALEETTSRLKLQLLGAKGIFAEYGDLNDPRAKRELLELALKTDDKQLLSAVENGDMNAVGHLLNTRDKIFQDLSKTKDAQDRADTELAEKERKANEVNAGLGLPPQPVREPGGGVEPTQQPFFPEGGAPGPAPAAPSEQPSAPAPSAPQQPPAAGGRPTPPAAGQPAEPAPAPAEGAPQEPAPPPTAGGEPSSTLPPVGVSAPTADDPLARLTPQEQAIARDVLAGGEMPKFPPEAAASETRIESAVAGLNQKLRQVSDNPNLKDENAVISQVRRVDPLTGDNLAAIAHNQMPLPGSESGTSGSGGSRGVMGYRNLMATLARKVNPQWDPGQWGGIEKFRDPSGLTQRSIGRITAIGDAGTKLQEDLKHIPDNPTQFQRQLDQFVKQGFTDDPAYSNLFTDWQTFIIDSNALTQGGQGLEGETEQMIKSIPMYGQKSAYEGALKRHASFALSRYQQYQNQWSQLQRTDAMFGHNDVAEKQIRDLANIKEGGPAAPQPGGGGVIIQNGRRYDPTTHQDLGPAQ